MPEKLSIALLGCGAIALKYAKLIRDHIADAELVSVCDQDAARAAAFAEEYGAKAFASLEEALHPSQRAVDIVVILTPSGCHEQHILEALRQGAKNIVVEKPMTLTLSGAKTVVRACRRAGARLFVVKQYRYNRAAQALKQAVDEGRFGRFVMGSIRLRWCRHEHYYAQGRWRGTWAQDGGVITNQTCHLIDLLTWLMGDVDSVFALADTRLADIEAEDTCVAVLRFRNGALGTIEATTATRPENLDASISILGERGTAVLGGMSADQIDVWRFENANGEDAEVLRTQAKNPDGEFAFAHRKYLEDVIRCVRDDLPASVDGIEGMRSLTVIHALYHSERTGLAARLSDDAFPASPLGIVPATPAVSEEMLTAAVPTRL